MDSIEALSDRLESIKSELPKLRSDVAQEQVEFNNKMDEIIVELEEYEKTIFDILKKRVVNCMPTETNPAIEEIYNESELYRSIIKMLGKDEDFVERFGFDRTIYEIGHAESVDRVNEVLKEFISDMKTIGIILSAENFNYSTFTLDYMDFFFDNMEMENYLFIMKRCFDDIYWECPLLLTHLELCVRNLVLNNKKIIVKHINHLLNKNLNSVKSNKEDIIDKYIKVRIQYEDLHDSDPFNMVEYFKKNRSELDRYVSPSIQFDQVVSSITDISYFYDLKDEDKTFFLNNVKDLYYDIKEYELIDKFKKLLDFVIGIYNRKDSLKGAYKTKLKDIAKLEKEKNTLDKKVNLLKAKRNRINDADKEKINAVNDSLRVVFNDLAIKIDNIKKSLDEATDLKFQETLANLLNPSTSIYEIIVFLSKYYGVLNNQIALDKKIEKDMVPVLVDEFRHIQYSAHLTVMKSTSFLNYNGVKELIEKKYNLYNIRVNIPETDSADYATLLDNLRMLIRYNDLLRMSLTPEDIIVMLKVTDILSKE